MKKAVLLLGLVALAAVLYLMAGNSEKSVVTVKGANTEPAVYLTFYGFKSGAQKVQEIEEILYAFMNQNPEVVIAYEGDESQQYLPALLKRFEGDHGDDIFMLNPSAMDSFARRGWIGTKVVDLQDLPLINKYSPLMKKWIQVDGKIPAVPLNMAVIGLLVNMDILRQCGIESAPRTYGAWLESMKKVKEKGYAPLVNYTGNDDSLMFFVVSRAFARMFYKEVPEPAEWTPESLFREALADAKNDILPLDGPTYDSYKQALKDFAAKGDAAFVIAPSWSLTYFHAGNPAFSYCYAGLPFSDKGPIVNARASIPVGINAESPHKNEALRFLEFMTHPRYIGKYSAAQNALSPLAGATNADNLYKPLIELINEGTVFSDSSPEIPFNAVTTLNALTRELAAGKDVDALFH